MDLRVILPAPAGAPGLDESAHSIAAQPGAEAVAVVVPGARDAEPMGLVAEGILAAGGDVIGWMMPGDRHFAWTVRAVVEIFRAHADVDWIASLRPAFVSGDGVCDRVDEVRGFAREAFADGRLGAGAVRPAATFFRRSLWDRAGGRFPEQGPGAAFALWTRLFAHADLVGVDIPLAVEIARPIEPARALAEARLVAELRADGGGPRLLRRAVVGLGLGRVPRVGDALERAVGYAGRRLSRPDRGAVGWNLERHVFS